MALEFGLNVCPCVKTACWRHGNCAVCIENHNGKPENPFPWCKREENAVLVEEILAGQTSNQ